MDASHLKRMWLKVSDLKPHPKVQRDQFSPRWAKELADKLDPDKLGTIAVVHCRGQWYVVDGQHRVAAVMQAFGTDQKIEYEVLESDDLANAADVFLGRNTRLGMRRIDKFMQEVNRGDEGPVAVVNILRRHGLQASFDHRNGRVAAVGACESVYRRDPKLLADTIKIIHATYGFDPDAYQGILIRGLAIALIRHPQITADGIVERLKLHEPDTLRAKATVLAGTKSMMAANAMAEVLVGIWNKGRRGRRIDNDDQ